MNNKNDNNYKEILSRLDCPTSNLLSYVIDKLKEYNLQTKEETFLEECIKEMDDITKNSIKVQTVNTLGIINSGIFASFFIGSVVVGATLPVALPIVASIGMLVLFANSLYRHYNKYNELNRVIYLIFMTTLRYYNIFNMMIKITKIYNFKLNIEGFTSNLSKLLNQLLLLATPEVFEEIKTVIQNFGSSRENEISRLFINIQKKKMI